MANDHVDEEELEQEGEGKDAFWAHDKPFLKRGPIGQSPIWLLKPDS